MFIVVVFAEKTIRHFKIEKIPCQTIDGCRTRSFVGWKLLTFLLNNYRLEKDKGFCKTVAQLTFQLPIAAQASKQFGWGIAPYSKISGYATESVAGPGGGGLSPPTDL